jgi:hypothetical protein
VVGYDCIHRQTDTQTDRPDLLHRFWYSLRARPFKWGTSTTTAHDFNFNSSFRRTEIPWADFDNILHGTFHCYPKTTKFSATIFTFWWVTIATDTHTDTPSFMIHVSTWYICLLWLVKTKQGTVFHEYINSNRGSRNIQFHIRCWSCEQRFCPSLSKLKPLCWRQMAALLRHCASPQVLHVLFFACHACVEHRRISLYFQFFIKAATSLN